MTNGEKIVRDWEIECTRGGFRSQAASFDWLARAIDDALDKKSPPPHKEPVNKVNLDNDHDVNYIGHSINTECPTYTRYINDFPEDDEFVSWNRY